MTQTSVTVELIEAFADVNVILLKVVGIGDGEREGDSGAKGKKKLSRRDIVLVRERHRPNRSQLVTEDIKAEEERDSTHSP